MAELADANIEMYEMYQSLSWKLFGRDIDSVYLKAQKFRFEP